MFSQSSMNRFAFLILGVAMALPFAATAQDMAPVALNSLSAAPSGLHDARVYDTRGAVIGQLKQVQTDQDGRPSAISIVPARGGVRVISAAAVSYDGHALVADTATPQQVAAR